MHSRVVEVVVTEVGLTEVDVAAAGASVSKIAVGLKRGFKLFNTGSGLGERFACRCMRAIF